MGVSVSLRLRFVNQQTTGGGTWADSGGGARHDLVGTAAREERTGACAYAVEVCVPVLGTGPLDLARRQEDASRCSGEFHAPAVYEASRVQIGRAHV